MVPRAAAVALAVATTLSASACQPALPVAVNNHTDITVRIQDLSGGPPHGVALKLKPDHGDAIQIYTPGGKCSSQLKWRAIDPHGNVVSTLTKACQGDTWNIEPKQ